MIYLDYAATRPLRQEALQAMLPYMTNDFTNPSSAYRAAMRPKAAINNAREQVALALNAQRDEICFASSGTEAINWAIKAAGKGHIITSNAEHHASLYSCQYMESMGYNVTYLPVDNVGMVSVKQVEDSIRDDTVLVNLIMANNEVGTISPIGEVGALLRRVNANRARKILFHTDAVQAVGHVPVDVSALGVDMLSMSAHKLYGPKGVGALYMRAGLRLCPFLHGGSQERGLRAGTENVAGIVGMGAAVELAMAELDSEGRRQAALRDYCISELLKLPQTKLNGHPSKRLPNNINISFGGQNAELLLLRLDACGISTSYGAACSSGALEPSHVLTALGLSKDEAESSLRLSLGRDTTKDELDFVVSELTKAIKG